MDATPPSTSIIILYSGAGYTFGNEIRNFLLSKMSCHELREIEMSGHGVIRRIFSKNVAKIFLYMLRSSEKVQ